MSIYTENINVSKKKKSVVQWDINWKFITLMMEHISIVFFSLVFSPQFIFISTCYNIKIISLVSKMFEKLKILQN